MTDENRKLEVINFKFEIGQIVTTSVTDSLTVKGNENQMLLHIVERQLIECPGGIQKYYFARGHTADRNIPGLINFVTQMTKFNEIELMPL